MTRRFLLDVVAVVIASLIVNALLNAWDNTTQRATVIAEPPARPAPTARPPTPVPTPVPTRPAPTTDGARYSFVYMPVRVWFHKEDALAYREALLDGAPTREFISLEKSRTIRGNLLLLIKSEDGLLFVRVEGTEYTGWIQ